MLNILCRFKKFKMDSPSSGGFINPINSHYLENQGTQVEQTIPKSLALNADNHLNNNNEFAENNLSDNEKDSCLESPTTKEKILVLSLDHDKCNEYSFIKKPDGKYEVDPESNLVKYIDALIRSKDYKNVIFMSGSGRQNVPNDALNKTWRHNGSSYKLMEILYDYFKNKLEESKSPTLCMLDKSLVADLFGHKKLGENFEYGLTYKGNFNESPQDRSKLLDTYLRMHMTSSQYSADYSEIDYYHFDDNVKVNKALQTLENIPTFIPKNMILHVCPFYAKNKLVSTNKVTINGIGKVNANYKQTIIQLAIDCGVCDPEVLKAEYCTALGAGNGLFIKGLANNLYSFNSAKLIDMESISSNNDTFEFKIKNENKVQYLSVWIRIIIKLLALITFFSQEKGNEIKNSYFSVSTINPNEECRGVQKDNSSSHDNSKIFNNNSKLVR